MGRRSNFNDKPAETHRTENFERRLRTTMGSELEPEMITPNTGGAEALSEYEEIFPLTKQFNQTNMRTPGGRRRSSDDQRQAKDHRPRSDEDDRT